MNSYDSEEISRALTAAGIPNTIQDTGGHIEVVYVHGNNKTYLGVTDDCLCHYQSDEDYDELVEPFNDDVTLDDIVNSVTRNLKLIDGVVDYVPNTQYRIEV